MMLQRLEAEGIKAYLQDEHTVTTNPVLTNALGGIKLMVYHEQLERATSLIEQFEKEYKQSLICPRCGSNDVQYIIQAHPENWLTSILTWLFGNYAIGTRKVYHCYNCGFETPTLPGDD